MPFKTNPGSNQGIGWLLIFGLLLWAMHLLLGFLAGYFHYGSPLTERPILIVVALLTLASVVYLVALTIAVSLPDGMRVTQCIWLIAVAMRLCMLGIPPILEVDPYRYLWDGHAVASGVSPYRYSPAQVLAAAEHGTSDANLNRLALTATRSEGNRAVLTRVHYPRITTCYPPVSQAVFASVSWLLPEQASAWWQLTTMKLVLTAFDLGTLALLFPLLRMTALRQGWAVAYGWCPLVVKEFSNSGHLDAIAVFLTVLALLLLVRSCRGPNQKRVWPAATVLGLAIGAKLYPVVLIPLFAAITWRRMSFKSAFAGLVTSLGVAAITLAPMSVGPSSEDAGATKVQLMLPGEEPRISKPERGLVAFLSRWRMNDLIFGTIEANLTPRSAAGRERSWAVVVPAETRGRLVDTIGNLSGLSPSKIPFLLARGMTATLFFAVAIVWAWKAGRNADARKWLHYAFLTLAWFWLLSPTVNPWYWSWALPFAPFTRCRAWLAMSVVALAYYVRFWCEAHYSDVPILGTRFQGTRFFDEIVVWFEFLPLLLVLLGESIWRRSAGQFFSDEKISVSG